jgi:alkylation response protein AidB-like acyl-CoA dehydrogenase
MYFALNEDQVALRDGVREVLAGKCPPSVVRAAWEDPAAVSVSVWRELTELGLPGAAVAADQGGLGLSSSDILPLLEETGRAAAPVPIVETAFVAAPLLAAAGRDEELERLLAGELLVACALDGSALVPYGQIAQLLLVSNDAGVGQTIGLLTAQGAVEPERSIDTTRALGRLVAAQEREPLRLAPADVVAAWRRGVLGTAAQLIGLSRTLLALTTDYVTDRHQFGVPVGSFQAIKHHLADALIAIEFAAPAVMRGAWSLDHGNGTTERDVAMAKATASEAAERVAAIAVQCHGAIAYTTEYDLHLFAKRVWSTSRSWGTAEWQRRRIAAALGL